MGNTASASEKIFKCTKEGNFPKVKAILDALAQNPQFRAHPGAVLDATDLDGNTALLVAAQGFPELPEFMYPPPSDAHFHIAEILIQRGASLHIQNARSDGGSALHEAVHRNKDRMIDLLLRSGACPFIENVKGFTAMDFACQNRNTALLRRMEVLAPWRGWLQQRVNAVHGPRWQRRWVVVCHRLPSPFPPPNRRARVSLLCYDSQQHTTPECRVWLDGARAEGTPLASNPGGCGGPRFELKLHHRHSAPSGCFITGDRAGYTLYFRPDEGALGANENIRAWAEKVNERHERRASQQQAPAGAPAGLAPRPSPLASVSLQPSPLSSGGGTPHWQPQQQQQQQQQQQHGYPTFTPAPVPAPAPAPPPPPLSDDKEDKVCCVCMDAVPDHGFLHDGTMHLVCCGPCAEDYKASGKPDCPFCRQKFSGIIKVF